MTKKKNTGFSMVEILISLAIFALLMIPIVSGIVSSLKGSTASKEVQYRNEFAENLMEHIKSVPIDDIQNEEYYIKHGTTAGTFHAETPVITNHTITGSTEVVKQTEFAITGKTQIGTQKTTYSYRVEVDNGYYVDKKVNNADFLDPNNLALGIVEDIDYNKVALIDGTILNYDSAAAKSFKTKKLQVLKETDETGYRQQIEGTGVDLFAGDTASRLTTIEVSGSETKGYTVKCLLDYIDDNTMLGTDNHIQYVPYAKTFDSGLPNIYLMYNPCYYNTDYSTDDYVMVDTSGLEDKTDVNIFLVEIAKQYSENIVNTIANDTDNKLDVGDTGRILYNDTTYNGGDREYVKIHMAAAQKSTGTADLTNIHVYHNIGDNVDQEGNTKLNEKSSIGNFWYKTQSEITEDEKNNGASEAVDSKLELFIDKLNEGLTASERKSVVALVSGSGKDAEVGSMNTATEENRSLYQVKIWLKKESEGAIDTSVDLPILQGTKGGNETR